MLVETLTAELERLFDLPDLTRFSREALGFDPAYSAAWKLLGKALLASDDDEGAASAWRSGIEAASGRGDIQAAKEMTVFLNRLSRR